MIFMYILESSFVFFNAYFCIYRKCFLIASPVSTEAKGDIDSRSVYVGNVSYFLQFFIQFLCVDKISISVIII